MNENETLQNNFQQGNYMPQNGMGQQQPKKKNVTLFVILGILGVLFMLTMVAVAIFVGTKVLGKKHINLNDYTSISFVGYDGHGEAVMEFDTDRFLEDYSDKLEYSKVGRKELGSITDDFTAAEYIVRNATGWFDGSYDLSNGDEVEFCWDLYTDDYDGKSYFNYTVENDDIYCTVSELDDVPHFNPFEYLNLTFEGLNGKGYANADVIESSEYKDSLYFSVNPSYDLSNGDTVTVEITSYDDDGIYVNCYGAIPETTKMTFTVSGLSEYYTTAKNLSEKDLKEFDKLGMNQIEGEFSNNWDDSIDLVDVSYVGNVFFAEKIITDDYGTKNRLYMVYKVTIDLKEDNYDKFEYYTYVYFDNLYGNEAGIAEDFRYNPYKNSHSSQYTTSTFYLTYPGFEQVDELLDYIISDTGYSIDNIGVKENNLTVGDTETFEDVEETEETETASE